jgi:acyl-CoA reductase-like NAD-dependent aldehyde dehydrogenase
MTAGHVADGPVRPDASVPLRRHRTLIGGSRVDARPRATFETVNPSSGRAWAEIPRAGREDVDDAVAAARAAFEDGPWAPAAPIARGCCAAAPS